MNINWEEIKEDASAILQNIVKINTSNPPGNEIEAAKYISQIAEENGLSSTIIETAPGRGNVVVSFEGNDGPPLILLSHLDVVGADRDDWEVDPFKGIIKDGCIWGRGTVDTKQLTVMELMTLILIKRNDIKLNKNIMLFGTADEESGSRYGIIKLLEDYGRIFKNASVISEGGGFPIIVNGRQFYLCETGQKGLCHIKFMFEKDRASNPYYPKNTSICSSSELIQRIYDYRWQADIPQTTKYLLNEIMKSCGLESEKGTSIEKKLESLKSFLSPLMLNLLKAMTGNTFAVTMWKGGNKNRRIINGSEVYIDCRILPGVTRDMVEEKLEIISRGIPVKWEITSFREGYESDFQGRLFNIFRDKIRKHIDASDLLPFIATGGSDGAHLRPYDSKVYGFSPVLASDMTFEKAVSMVHGINERISVDSLVFGVRILFESILEYCEGGN